ncbi:MAG: hypothetical protein KBC64_02310 [Simkaniaceae bacterium]|nr:hypothetical protein [Simkaniaceae bacterium]
MKVRHLSLIELLICLVFLTLITSSLLHLVSRYAIYSASLSQLKFQELNRQKCIFRLKSLLLQSTQGIEITPQGFKFSFDNGADPDPLFCHELQALVVQEHNQLLLYYGPDEASFRSEILYSPLTSFSYEVTTDDTLLLTFNDKLYPLFLKP